MLLSFRCMVYRFPSSGDFIPTSSFAFSAGDEEIDVKFLRWNSGEHPTCSMSNFSYELLSYGKNEIYLETRQNSMAYRDLDGLNLLRRLSACDPKCLLEG